MLLQYVNYYSDMLSILQLGCIIYIRLAKKFIHIVNYVVQYSSWCMKSMYFLFT